MSLSVQVRCPVEQHLALARSALVISCYCYKVTVSLQE